MTTSLTKSITLNIHSTDKIKNQKYGKFSYNKDIT